MATGEEAAFAPLYGVGAVAIFAILALSACAATTSLDDGTSSTLPSAQASFRSSLTVTLPDRAVTLTYKPVKQCIYEEEYNAVNDPAVKHQLIIAITMTKQHDKYLVTLHRDRDVFMSGLIGPTGKLFNYTSKVPNAPDLGVVNPTNVDHANRTLIERQRQSMNPVTQTNPRSINTISLLLPEWLRPFKVQGEAAGYLLDESRAVWATYVYRGLTNYKGREGVLFDLQRTIPSLGNESLTIGFSIVDPKTALPLFLAFRAGSGNVLEQISCE